MNKSFALFFLLILFSASILAQVDRATINGTVKDASGAVVPGARVTVTSPSTGLTRETITESNGYFVAAALPTNFASRDFFREAVFGLIRFVFAALSIAL